MPATSPWTRMSPLELASGAVWGRDPDTPGLAPVPAGRTARAALEDAVRPMLQAPPCGVSFSGGRDSSAVLAVATHVARRDGLPPPIPVTLRFPRYEPAEESEWQDLVVRHLGLDDWVCIELNDEIDVVGPYGRRVMTEHGVMWPANAYVHLPIAEAVAGGSLLTGIGGDETFSVNHLFVRANQVLSGQVFPRPRDLLRVGAFLGPRFVRRAAMRRNGSSLPPWTWLAGDAELTVRARLLDDLTAEPLRWDASIDLGWWRSRIRRLGEDSLDRVVHMAGVRASSPLTDPGFLAAYAQEGGRIGPLGRTYAMRELVGDLLPDQLLARASKAEMGGAFLGELSREFAAGWDGSGVDQELVLVDELRRMWSDPHRTPDFRTFPLLQSAWLSSASGEVHRDRR